MPYFVLYCWCLLNVQYHNYKTGTTETVCHKDNVCVEEMMVFFIYRLVFDFSVTLLKLWHTKYGVSNIYLKISEN